MSSVKYLFIVRHGKSTMDYKDIPDYDRPLKERGINDSYKIAENMVIKKKIPKLIISSPAIRALHTAMIFARIFNYKIEKIQIHKELYMSSESENLDLLKNIDSAIDSVMIVGHNPSFTDLANHFLTDKLEEIPTSGLVSLKFEAESWNNIDSLKPVDYFFDFPKHKKHSD